MRRLIAVTVVVFLSASLIATAGAEAPPENAKPQGIKQVKKAMQGKKERSQKVGENKKKAAEIRQQAQSGN